MQQICRRFFAAIVLGTLCTANSSFAGSRLRLQAGQFELRTMSSSFSTNTHDVFTEYILQFTNPITSKDKAELRKNFEVFGYLPDDSLVVRGTRSKVQKYSAAHPEINGFIPYAAQFKLAQELLALSVFNQDEVLEIGRAHV